MKCSFRIADYPVYRFEMPAIESNMYVLPVGQSCLVVDPCISEEAGKLLRNCEIKDCLVLLTHEHYDHISGVNWLRGQVKCQLVCSKICADCILNPKKNASAYFNALFFDRDEATQKKILEMADTTYSCHADVTYIGRLEFEWNGLKVEMGEAPGHSPGSQIIRINEKYYFPGDYLIPGEPVITRLPGGSKCKYETVTKPYLQDIEPDSIICPGHGKPGTFLEIVGQDFRSVKEYEFS